MSTKSIWIAAQATSLEQQYFRKRSQKAVEKLREAYCNQTVLRLWYGEEEGGDRLAPEADDYLRLDREGVPPEQEGRPSQTFLVSAKWWFVFFGPPLVATPVVGFQGGERLLSVRG